MGDKSNVADVRRLWPELKKIPVCLNITKTGTYIVNTPPAKMGFRFRHLSSWCSHAPRAAKGCLLLELFPDTPARPTPPPHHHPESICDFTLDRVSHEPVQNKSTWNSSSTATDRQTADRNVPASMTLGTAGPGQRVEAGVRQMKTPAASVESL